MPSYRRAATLTPYSDRVNNYNKSEKFILSSSGSAVSTNEREEVEISIIAPMFNEAGNLDALFERLVPILENTGKTYEIICVDDGSTDDTLEKLSHHRNRNQAVCIISLARNFGKEIALTAGLDHARGAAVISIDSDLQHPPELIPTFIEKWSEGYDVVYARRRTRDDESFLRKFLGNTFYLIYNKMVDVEIPRDGGDFRLFDRKVVNAICQLRERNRFMKGLYSWVGFRQFGVDFEPDPRQGGSSSWSLWKLWNFALDGITSFGTLPLRVWLYVGIFVAVVSFIYATFLIVRTLMEGIDVPGYASLIVLILFFGGVQLISLGVIGEYLGRVYQEVKERPLYIVKRSEGLPKE